MTTRIASCSCGQLSVTVSDEPVRVSVCHCLACQRRTGSVFGAQARFRRERVSVEGQSTRYERIADSGNRITFHFCPICGATVHYAIEGHEELVAVPIGAFADPDFPPPAFSVYEQRMHGWISVPGNWTTPIDEPRAQARALRCRSLRAAESPLSAARSRWRSRPRRAPSTRT